MGRYNPKMNCNYFQLISHIPSSWYKNVSSLNPSTGDFVSSGDTVRTFDLQLAGDCGLSLGVLGSAGVRAAVKAAGLADLQGANALVRDLTKLGVVTNDHLIFQPLDLWLRGEAEDTKSTLKKKNPKTKQTLYLIDTFPVLSRGQKFPHGLSAQVDVVKLENLLCCIIFFSHAGGVAPWMAMLVGWYPTLVLPMVYTYISKQLLEGHSRWPENRADLWWSAPLTCHLISG